jgi:hypothetical protein
MLKRVHEKDKFNWILDWSCFHSGLVETLNRTYLTFSGHSNNSTRVVVSEWY